MSLIRKNCIFAAENEQRTSILIMNPKDNSQINKEAYEKIMKDFSPSQYINTKWKNQNGFFKQYSVYDDNCVTVSGTINSIKAL